MARFLLVVLLVALLAAASAWAGSPSVEAFRSPPAEAWPRTWWHWTRGMVRKEGITKDLEWMKRVGIEGFQVADVNFGGGQTVEPTVDFGTPEWLVALGHAAREAERLDLEMAVFSSPGWSLTGAPWVEPQQAMKKLVWSETRVTGPADGWVTLAKPPANAGPFQDVGAARSRGAGYYKDVAVLAFLTPRAEVEQAAPESVAASAGEIDGALLFDQSYARSVVVAPEDDGPAWIEQRFAEPTTIRSITIAGDAGIPVGRVTASVDGESYRTLVTLPGTQLYRQARIRTFAIPPTTATVFRLELTGGPIRPAETMGEPAPAPAKRYTLSEWRLDAGARAHRWEEKAGFGHLFEYESIPTPAVDQQAVLLRDQPVPQQLDLSELLQPDGELRWKPPAGEWTVLRIGYSLTGARNRPATPAGSGLEVDKLSARHVSDYYDAYAALLRDAVGDLYGKRLSHWLIDSWEAGTQNWTEDLPAEFERRRGYSLVPYLPALTGRIVGDAATTDRFLWDFRRTLADLYADSHYGVLGQRLEADGLAAYSEASGVSLEIPEDTLLNKSKVAIPMGEFWVRDLHPHAMYLEDVRGAASAALAYGKPVVAAEAFTGGGYESPFTLKKVSDYWFSEGLNRLVFHTSAHQPLDKPPGNVMVGTHLHRHITWAEQARPLNEYFARVCYLLQQGRQVADIGYLLPDGAPSTPPVWGAGVQPAPPKGYKHAYLNADALLGRVSVDDQGHLTLPDGPGYRLLVLPDSEWMRPEVAEKLLELVRGGATIVGRRPSASPSLADQPEADARLAELTAELWGDLNGATRTVRYVGEGRVVWGRALTQVLERLDLPKDFEWAGPLDARVAWTHRSSPGMDVYYVSNLTDLPVDLSVRFRVAGREATVWRPDTGAVESLATEPEDRSTRVLLELERNETVFVVFGGPSTPAAEPSDRGGFVEVAPVAGPWSVSFPDGPGAPDDFKVDELASLANHDDASVHHFSGTASYTTTFGVAEDWLGTDAPLWIDLGDVRDLAEVRVNGEPLAELWKPPYRVDVTDALRPGENWLEVRVTNQWTNRIVGDLESPPGERVLLDDGPFPWFGPRALAPSGLIGPVRLLSDLKRGQAHDRSHAKPKTSFDSAVESQSPF